MSTQQLDGCGEGYEDDYEPEICQVCGGNGFLSSEKVIYERLREESDGSISA